MSPMNGQIGSRFVLYLLIASLPIAYATSDSPIQFNVTIKVPENASIASDVPHKSVHVRYALSNHEHQWHIVGFEPALERSDRMIQQMTIHLCDGIVDPDRAEAMWFDDETGCRGARSMLIYEWTPHVSLSPFEIADENGIRLDKSKTVVLTVTYFKERLVRKERPGVILYLSNKVPRYRLGTIIVGNKEQDKRFSCRSSTYPRSLYAVKRLFSSKATAWWQIFVIRNRQFGRKSVEPVLDSTLTPNTTEVNVAVLSPDIFVTPGDYLLLECENNAHFKCHFLIYYSYRNVDHRSTEDDHRCQRDNYPRLFRLVPSEPVPETSPAPSFVSTVPGTTIFLVICIFLFVLWISVIIGCIIWRRIRGLVNFRSEPSTPLTSQPNNALFPKHRFRGFHSQQKTANENDHVAQTDFDHLT